MGSKGFSFVVFDLDGTLCDTLADIATAANRVLSGAGLVPLPESTIRGYVGRGVRDLMRRCTEGTRVDLERIIAEFMKTYGAALTERTRPYAGVAEGLARLASVKKAVASNKPEAMSRAILDDLGLSRHFLRVTGGDSFPKRKPDPLPVTELMRQFGADAESTLVVGDSDIDRETAEAAGVRSCLVTYGYTPRERLAGADWIAENFGAVVKIVLGREPPDIA